MNIEQLVDHEVTLRGIAVDDAACAIVEAEDVGRGIYLVDLASWGRDAGKRVEVTGTLRHRRIGSAGGPAPGAAESADPPHVERFHRRACGRVEALRIGA